MSRRQLDEDVSNAESDFDPEEDQAQYEHYRVNGNAPRLMPDLSRIAQKYTLPVSFFGGDSIYG